MKTKEMKQNRTLFIVSLSIMILIIAMSMSNVLNAQPIAGQHLPPSTPNSKQIKTIMADLSKELSLSCKQKIQIMAIYEDHIDEVKKVMKLECPDSEKMEAIKDVLKKEVSEILTEKQQQLFTAYTNLTIKCRIG